MAVIFSTSFDVCSTCRLSDAFRWVLQAPADLVILGGERPDPNAVSLLRQVRADTNGSTVLVAATQLEGWLQPPQSLLIDGVFERPSQLLDLIERAHVLLKARTPIGAEANRSQPRRAIEYIAATHSPVPRARDVARHTGVSVAYLSAVFRRAVGMTLKEYLTRVRIEIIKHLLTETDEGLDTIAETVGLCDAGYLCRLFVRYVGRTPGKFRRAGSEPWGESMQLGTSASHHPIYRRIFSNDSAARIQLFDQPNPLIDHAPIPRMAAIEIRHRRRRRGRRA